MTNRNETKKNRARKGLLGLVMAAAICSAAIIPASASVAKASDAKLTNAVEGVFDTISVNTIQGAIDLKDDEITRTVQTAVAEGQIERIAALGLVSFGG